MTATSLKDSVLDYCTLIGTDPMLVQGAGGNVSWKEGDTLWIKASGTWLAEAKARDIFVPVDLADLLNGLKDGNFAVTPKIKGDSLLRSSIETLLHAIMPHRVVVHLHAIVPLAYLVRCDAEAEIGKKMPRRCDWGYVNYQKPGEALAKAVAAALITSPGTSILLLENHGVVIGGADVDEIHYLLTQLVSALYVEPVLKSVVLKSPEPIVACHSQEYIPFDMLDVHNLAMCPDLYDRIRYDWALYPDHVVFMGPQPKCYDSVHTFSKDIKFGIMPEVFFLKGYGVFTTSDISLAKQAQLKCYYEILIRQNKYTRLKSLNSSEVAELLDWDAEKYRQHLARPYSVVKVNNDNDSLLLDQSN